MQTWNAWSASWLWSLALIAITIAMHLVGVGLIVNAVERFRAKLQRSSASYLGSTPATIAVIVAVALGLALLHGIESLTWAIAYVRLGAFTSPADAALYSVDSMTTRGASGLVPEEHWRMMGAVEAGDGMLLFGISTAFLFYVMLRLWKTDAELR
jgi:type IV secretory pathway VirB2 component (pilin)